MSSEPPGVPGLWLEQPALAVPAGR